MMGATRSIGAVLGEDRTHYAFGPREIPEALLRQLWDLARMGPTSSNCSPLRIVFVRSPAHKARLIEAVSEGNREKVRQAPVTAILAQDMAFHEQMDRLFPHVSDARSRFTGLNETEFASTALRNGSLQAAYFLLAARGLGIDCGPLSGFDPEAVEEGFLRESGWRVNFLCNLGYGTGAGIFARLPRLDFDEACRFA